MASALLDTVAVLGQDCGPAGIQGAFTGRLSRNNVTPYVSI